MGKYDGLEGKKFNRLTIIKRTEGKKYFYDCLCDCGKIVSVNQYHVVLGTTKSCGCASVKDLSGKRFGKLVATKPCGKKNNKTVWLCICDCGNEVEVVGTALSIGNTNSCGCTKTKHRMFGTRLYNVWHTMKERCYVESQTSYKNYGGRGIKVCPEWQEFIPFMEWSYANGYDENAKRGECTLDRIDPNGDYSPDNCRWVSMSIQANNKRDNVYIEYNGIVDTLSNHARREGVSPVLAETRKIKGKSVDEIFSKKKEAITLYYKGENRKINDICRIAGVSRNVIERRVLKNGEDLDMVILSVKSMKRRPIIRNRPVYQFSIYGNFIKKWDNGAKQAGKELGLNPDAIRNCCLGNSKKSQGYIWKYEEDVSIQ